MNKWLAKGIDIAVENFISYKLKRSKIMRQTKPRLDNPEQLWEKHSEKLNSQDSLPSEVIIEKLATLRWGECYQIKFSSRIETEFPENNHVHGRLFTPLTSSLANRPALVLLPGWLSFSYYPYQQICAAFATQGFNCLVLALPYHLERTPEQCFSGEAMLTPDLPHSFTAICQALIDTQQAISWLFSQKASSVGIMGISLGGYLAALLSSYEPRLSYSILWAPATALLKLLRQSRICSPLRCRLYTSDLHRKEIFYFLETIDEKIPATPPRSKEHVLFIQGIHDRIIRPRWTERWAQKWENPPLIYCPHGHISGLFDRQLANQIVCFARRCLHTQTAVSPLWGQNPE